MNLRQHIRARKAQQQAFTAVEKMAQEYSEFMHAQAAMDDDWDGEFEPRDATCSHCSGTGGDPWNDGITPCEFCDGEGYRWWQ